MYPRCGFASAQSDICHPFHQQKQTSAAAHCFHYLDGRWGDWPCPSGHKALAQSIEKNKKRPIIPPSCCCLLGCLAPHLSDTLCGSTRSCGVTVTGCDHNRGCRPQMAACRRHDWPDRTNSFSAVSRPIRRDRWGATLLLSGSAVHPCKSAHAST